MRGAFSTGSAEKGNTRCRSRLYEENYEGTRKPSETALLGTLREVLEETQHVYIIVDAIDECENRVETLEVLRKLALWNLQGLHLMVTSRSERDFEDSFQGFHQIGLEGEEHNKDIERYVRQQLLEEREWHKWSAEVQQQITAVVVEKAEDMFRLAKLHLDRLQKCKIRQALQQTMRALPLTLHDTYDRILTNIALEYCPDALRILSWVCFSMRPLTLPELAAALAVDLDSLEYDHMQEYQDADEILDICGSLLKRSEENGKPVVKLSHASVKDYLTSNRNLRGDFQKLSSGSSWANEQICAVCLVYLTAHNYNDEEEALASHSDSPLIGYATNFWSEHFRRAGESAILSRLARDLLLGHSSRYIRWAWIGIFMDHGFYTEQPSGDLNDLQTRLNIVLYLTAFIGSIDLIDDMLRAGANVNGRGGVFDSPLAAAIRMENFKAVKHLLQAGADVNSRAGPHGDVLKLASFQGVVEAVDLLLSSGANVNSHGGIFQTALCAVVSDKRKATEISARLIDAGADPSAGLTFFTPLSDAAGSGNHALVKLLIDAKVNVNDGSLHGALRNGHLQVAQMLIEAGAKSDYVHETMGIALGAAALHGIDTLRFLVEGSRVDIHSVDKEGRNALHVVASTGRVETVQYLLKLGLRVSSKDKKGWSAVHHAASASTPDCLRILLPAWTPDTSGWTPLHLACRANHPEAIDLLLEAGLHATPIETEIPLWRWNLFDIAVWHRNWNLITPEAEALHQALQQESRFPDPRDFQMALMQRRAWRCCDGCQPAQVS